MVSLQEREQLGKRIIEGLYDEGMILTWYRARPEGWILRGGLWSPYYINLRLLPSSPELYSLVGNAMGMLLKELGYKSNGNDRVVGIAMAGIPIADAVALLHEIPALYTRKLPEEVRTPEDLQSYIEAHGQHALVEGEFYTGDRLAVVDDLVTGFDSKLLAIRQINQETQRRGVTGITLQDVAVLLDREQGGVERARDLGFNLYSLVPFISKGLDWLREKLSQTEYDTIVDYVRDTEKYQDPELQQHLKQLA
ncbi:MAG: hypothetical protein HYT70_00060 [Candidatus Aenigmarchaeota archaeon]|nr:hypothetical protein [Candidatus Aenigmarchaeota archaeon]